MAILDKNIQILMLKGEKGDPGDAGDYSTLSNKPTINNTALVGNKSASDLGLATASDLSGMGSTVNTNTANITTLANNMGAILDLETTDKTSIVNAINEVNNKTFDKFASAGDWTPTLTAFEGTAPTVTYATRWGHYYKLGRLVYITARMTFNITNVGTGYAAVSGLPFMASDAIFALSKFEALGATQNDATNPTFNVNGAQNMIRVQNQAGAGANVWVTGSGAGSQQIGFSGVYLTDE